MILNLFAILWGLALSKRPTYLPCLPWSVSHNTERMFHKKTSNGPLTCDNTFVVLSRNNNRKSVFNDFILKKAGKQTYRKFVIWRKQAVYASNFRETYSLSLPRWTRQSLKPLTSTVADNKENPRISLTLKELSWQINPLKQATALGHVCGKTYYILSGQQARFPRPPKSCFVYCKLYLC